MVVSNPTLLLIMSKKSPLRGVEQGRSCFLQSWRSHSPLNGTPFKGTNILKERGRGDARW